MTTIDESSDVTSTTKNPKVLDVDYDDNPTIVYKFIEDKEWEFAIARAKSSPEEVRTWVTRREKNGKLRWKLLPLHAAVIFKAPGWVVESLVKFYPQATRCKDDQGMIPIHLAFRNDAPEDAVEVLLATYPEGIKCKDRKGRIPLAHTRSMQCPYKGKVIRAYAEAHFELERAAIEEREKKRFEDKMNDVKTVTEDATNAVHEELAKSREDVERLEKEVAQLKSERELHIAEVNDLQKKIDDMSTAMANITSHHDEVLRHLTKNKEEIHANAVVRERIMMALINQEKDNVTSEMNRIETMIRTAVTQRQMLIDSSSSLSYDGKSLLDNSMVMRAMDSSTTTTTTTTQVSPPYSPTEKKEDERVMNFYDSYIGGSPFHA